LTLFFFLKRTALSLFLFCAAAVLPSSLHLKTEKEKQKDALQTTHPFAPPIIMTSITVRVRMPKSSAPVQTELDLSGTWGEAAVVLSEKSGVALNRMRVLAGFPPKPIEPVPTTPLTELKLRQNDMLIIQEGEAKVQLGNTGERYVPPASERAHFTRRRCPADNSCLFHACAYVLHDKSRTDGPLIRQECVQAIREHPEMFNINTLGMDPVEYTAWISQRDTWGGAIELEVLSYLYRTEIFALDLQSATVQKFGTGMGYTVRVFLVYTGNHYDCIAMNPTYNSSSERDDQTLFNSRDDNVLQRATRFVAEEGKKMKEGNSL
jgi:ubiquitin thioesterase OTU1